MIELNVRMPRLFAEGPGQLEVQTSLEVRSFTAVYGPSGAGKTTLLRILAGLIQPDKGCIVVDGEIWLDTAKRKNRAVQERAIGFVFQDTALFPNMTVRENLTYAAANRKDPFIDELLHLIGLESFVDRKPDTLSGGQRQRVALARALVRRPKVLLLDEPFSSLDTATAQLLREQLLKLHHYAGTTTLMVTHSQEDIQQLADRKIGMEQGRIQADDKVPAITAQNASVTESILYVDQEKQLIETANFQIISKNDSAQNVWNNINSGDELEITLKKAPASNNYDQLS